MPKRGLRREEISRLEAEGCRSREWERISVTEDFRPDRQLRRVIFSGDVGLGRFQESPNADPDRPAGIEDAFIRDSSLGDNCRIRRASLSGVEVGDGAVIDSVGEISALAEPPSPEEMRANALAEDGARSVPLWHRLSAQLAHVLCHMRNTRAAEALEKMIRLELAAASPNRCHVGQGARIVRCGQLINVWLGERAQVAGAARLENCRIESSAAAPTRVGEGVIARHSLFLSGSETRDRVSLAHCLAGEGVILENGFSAEHSLFFANSHLALGEALSVLAGPLAVSHHKATLLLACQCSFGNFGSGANSSNHHFKLGPRHGGMLRRGVNCGSGSYLLWPSDLGAFTTVIGRHPRRLDTSAFPFSLLLDEEGESLLVPGVNVFSAGGFRDVRKWRERERRRGIAEPLDLVNPARLSPVTIQAMDKGMAILERADPGDIRHHGALIPAGRRRTAAELYGRAQMFYCGERLLLAAEAAGGKDALPRLLESPEPPGLGGEWRDWGGMLLPGGLAGEFLSDLAEGGLSTPEAALGRLREIHAAYDRLETAWIAARWRREYGPAGAGARANFFAKWRETVIFRRERLLRDMAKEFGAEAALGFGLEEEAETAFARVRGRFEDSPPAAAVRRESEELLALAEKLGG
ncbi:MAG: DUF4954 family protein [Planctomycetota bacterium]|jgi:hypothetical protein|nr:DUF4954 family protein [Planctomycetota bacterium]